MNLPRLAHWQMYALDQWGLAEPQMRLLFVLIPTLSALSNVISGPAIGALGIVGFTAIATVSNLLFWVRYSYFRSQTMRGHHA